MSVRVAAEDIGAWARPLKARIWHFFLDGRSEALCGAYLLRDVEPSRWLNQPPDWSTPLCQTCERKRSYFFSPSPLAAIKATQQREANR